MSIIKTFSDIVSDLISSITRSHPEADTKEGTLLRDIVIDAPARELSSLYESIDDVSNAQSLALGTDADIVAFGKNWMIYRKGAVKSTGYAIFWRTAIPSVDITIPIGTIVATKGTSSTSAIQFATTEAATMLQSIAATYYNATTGKYEISIPVEAITGGSGGNISSQTIAVLVQGISGIDGVYNSAAFTGGLDQESIADLKDRILARVLGNSIGTSSGYSSLLLADSRVSAVQVLGPSSTEMHRADGGAVDVYIKGVVHTAASDSFSPTVPTYHNLIVSSQPAITSGITTVTSSGSGSLQQGVTWEWLKDTGNYAGSTSGRDAISWLTTVDSSYGAIAIAYHYNSLITDLQSVIDKPQNHIVAADVLVKEATAIPIDITASIQVTSGFTPATVIANVITSIGLALDGLAIGADVLQSAIVVAIVGTTGVDNVSTPFTKFESTDGTYTRNANYDIEIPDGCYATSGTITITAS